MAAHMIPGLADPVRELTLTAPRFIDWILLMARTCLSIPFLFSGFDKCWRWAAAQREVAASGVPWPTLFHIAVVATQLGAGISVLIGMEARLGAAALCLFLIPVTVLYHPFWKRSGPDLVTEADHFLLNVAVIGGLLLIVGFGGGRISVFESPLEALVP
jgi:putative oxidoreductase